MPDTIALAADFPHRTRADWEAAATKALKGGALADLAWSTYDGVDLGPLYAADDEVRPVVAPRVPAADPARPWDLRARVDQAAAAQANAAALAELEGGAASLLLSLDRAGERGVRIADRDDLARALDGVLLDLAPVALDAGFAGPLAAEWLGDLAKAAPRAPLALHLDPVSAFAAEGASPGPVVAHLARAAETAARLAPTYPAATLAMAGAFVVHEAGGSKSQELGFAAASALAWVKALDAAGLPPADALQRILLGLSVDGEYLCGLAKLRAARLIWARLCQALGADVPACIEARGSRRSLARVDAWTNLLRSSAAAFAGAVGGADAVVLTPFTAPLGPADAFARRQARNIQLVLMEEAHLGRVDDPAAGSWFLDGLTRQLAEAGWAQFQAIEGRGGVVAALTSGWLAEQVADVAARRRADLAEGRAQLIGVTRFTDPTGRAPAIAPADRSPPPQLDVGLPGADDRCPPLTPIRLAQPFEEALP